MQFRSTDIARLRPRADSAPAQVQVRVQAHARGHAQGHAQEHVQAPALTIGEAARLSGCTPEAIRYYEREGVIPSPPRAGSGRYRHYRRSDVDRLRFLRRARELGFSLAEVRTLLTLAEGDPTRQCADVDRLARAHLATVESKLAQLGALRDKLTDVIGRCRGGLAVADCRILGALGDA